MHGSDFTFMGLWHALPWIRVFRMNVDTKIPCVFSQWSPYNQSGRWYRMCKTNRDHKNTYLSKLVLQAVVVSQINFACFWNWNSNKQRSGKDVSNYFLIWSPLKSPRSFSCKLQYALINSLGASYLFDALRSAPKNEALQKQLVVMDELYSSLSEGRWGPVPMQVRGKLLHIPLLDRESAVTTNLIALVWFLLQPAH